MREALSKFKEKIIHVVMEGSGAAQSGKLLTVSGDWFVLSTRWSNKHWFNTNKVISFWGDDDKPEDLQ